MQQILTHKLQLNKTPEYLNVKPKVFNPTDKLEDSGNKKYDDYNLSKGSGVKINAKKDSKISKNDSDSCKIKLKNGGDKENIKQEKNNELINK